MAYQVTYHDIGYVIVIVVLLLFIYGPWGDDDGMA